RRLLVDPPPPPPTLFPYTTLFRSIWYKPEPVKTSNKNGVSYKWLYVKTEHGVEGWMALVQPGATPQKPDAQFVPKVVTPPVEERSEEHTSELQSRENLVCRLLLEK